MSIYERIESLRKSEGISQGKLEKELGFSNGSISKWKTSTPNPERIQKLADYFKVSVDYLVTGKDPQVDYLYTDENATFLIEVTNRAKRDADFVRRMTAYMSLLQENRKSVDDMIDFLSEKEKKDEA